MQLQAAKAPLLSCLHIALLWSLAVGTPTCVDADCAAEDSSSLIQHRLGNGKDIADEDSADEASLRRRTRLGTWRQAFEANPGMFKGCSKIFLDVGANRGTHVRKLFEPQKYPSAPFLHIFDTMFGSPEQRNGTSGETGLCAFGFEANPRWVSTLESIEDAYAKQGWRVQFFAPNAVSTKEQKMVSMYLNDHDGENSDWGMSVNHWSKDAQSVVVPGLDLADFMVALNKASPQGVRVMKMDIEGSEYGVLSEFLSNGLLCKPELAKLTIEWHKPTSQEAQSSAGRVRARVEAGEGCPRAGLESTEVAAVDDESYLDDGQPLP